MTVIYSSIFLARTSRDDHKRDSSDNKSRSAALTLCEKILYDASTNMYIIAIQGHAKILIKGKKLIKVINITLVYVCTIVHCTCTCTAVQGDINIHTCFVAKR